MSRLPCLALLLLTALPLLPQENNPAEKLPEEDISVSTEHPRLLLPPRRLRLLQRERERDSSRFRQLETLIVGKAAMPEPGFAWALYYQVSGAKEFGKQAVDWALNPQSKDLRQLALVFDWCQPLLSEAQSKVLAEKLVRGAAALEDSKGIPQVRDRVLALIALVGHGPKNTEEQLKLVVNEWWRKQMAPGLRTGSKEVPRQDSYAMFEMLHALRDSTNVELRQDAAKYFKELPAYHILSYYPAIFPAAENEYRIPFYTADGEPDLKTAALSRAGDLAMVAYDTNAQETQFVQSWLIHDRFTMRGVFGITYEFLWANPYQPGLSYYHLPLFQHHSASGKLVLRSSWDDDAAWFHFSGMQAQMFEGGVRKDLKLGSSPKPIEIAGTMIYFYHDNFRLDLESEAGETIYLLGLKPNTAYDVESDDRELEEKKTDAGGILPWKLTPKSKFGLRLRQSPVIPR